MDRPVHDMCGVLTWSVPKSTIPPQAAVVSATAASHKPEGFNVIVPKTRVEVVLNADGLYESMQVQNLQERTNDSENHD